MARTITRYLDELRRALRGADPAVIHDALYDADEHLRFVVADRPQGVAEDEAVAAAIAEYGTADEIASAYLAIETTVVGALRTPPPPRGTGPAARFFGVMGDARVLGALAYLIMAAATGIAYFGIVVGGGAVGASLIVFIIGIPYLLLYVGTVRAVSLVEGRIVETLLGERMPRRPLLGPSGRGWLERFRHWFTDRRTWTTIVYLALQGPLGVAYLIVFGGGLVAGLWAIVMPILQVIVDVPFLPDRDGVDVYLDPWAIPVVMACGLVAIALVLHAARFVGRLHGRYAKWMLVGSFGGSAGEEPRALNQSAPSSV